MAAVSAVYEKIIKYIDENIKNEITLADISKHAGYSQWHLYKIFKIYSPAPIMEYIRNKRLYAAANEKYIRDVNYTTSRWITATKPLRGFTRLFRAFSAVSRANIKLITQGEIYL